MPAPASRLLTRIEAAADPVGRRHLGRHSAADLGRLSPSASVDRAVKSADSLLRQVLATRKLGRRDDEVLGKLWDNYLDRLKPVDAGAATRLILERLSTSSDPDHVSVLARGTLAGIRQDPSFPLDQVFSQLLMAMRRTHKGSGIGDWMEKFLEALPEDRPAPA